MEGLATTKMSSKGQVVIPEEIRKRLGLKSGSQFVVVGDKDTVILVEVFELRHIIPCHFSRTVIKVTLLN